MRELLVDPDPRLRKICTDITVVDTRITTLAREMEQFAEKTGHLLGLAAPQLGELVKLFIIRVPGYEAVLMNPRIVYHKGTQRMWEECLSLPGKTFLVKRPKIMKIKALDLTGRERTVKGSGLLARVLMHELEHLHGIMVDNVAIKVGAIEQ